MNKTCISCTNEPCADRGKFKNSCTGYQEGSVIYTSNTSKPPVKTTIHQCPHCHQTFEEEEIIDMTARF